MSELRKRLTAALEAEVAFYLEASEKGEARWPGRMSGLAKALTALGGPVAAEEKPATGAPTVAVPYGVALMIRQILSHIWDDTETCHKIERLIDQGEHTVPYLLDQITDLLPGTR